MNDKILQVCPREGCGYTRPGRRYSWDGDAETSKRTCGACRAESSARNHQRQAEAAWAKSHKLRAAQNRAAARRRARAAKNTAAKRR